MAKAFTPPTKPTPHARGDDHPIVIDDELDKATARIEQMTSEMAALHDQNATLVQEVRSLTQQMIATAVPTTQAAMAFSVPFRLLDANHAARVVAPDGVLSLRLPEGIISAHVRTRLHSLSEGLRESGARLADGTYVTAWNHGLRWLLEHLRCGEDDVMPVPKPGQRY